MVRPTFYIFLIVACFLKHWLAYGTVELGGQAGEVSYVSSASDLMNKRLGNSPALTHKYQHGRAYTFGADLTGVTKESLFVFGLFAHGFAEQMSATSTLYEGLTVNSQLVMGMVNVGFGKSLIRAKVSGFSKPVPYYLHLIGLAGAGSVRHVYSMKYPQENTEIDYATGAQLATGGLLVRFGYEIFTHVYLRIDVMGVSATPYRSQAKLNKFVVQGQDLSFAEKELKLSEIAQASYFMTFYGLGISAAL